MVTLSWQDGMNLFHDFAVLGRQMGSEATTRSKWPTARQEVIRPNRTDWHADDGDVFRQFSGCTTLITNTWPKKLQHEMRE